MHMRPWRSAYALLGACLIVTATGCAQRRSSLLMERRARGPFALERQYGTRQVVYVHPPERTIKQDGIEMTVRFASMGDLNKYFHHSEIFGKDAGLNPFQAENVVFYVQVVNHSGKRISMDPDQFVLVDDLGIQYSYLSPDYLNALAESRVTVGQTTRLAISKAPSVYGVDVGGFASNLIPQSQKRLALLKQVSFSRGTLFPGVVYDGYISFIRPHKDAKHLTLIVSNVKTDFDASDIPKRAVDFPFEFDVTQAIVPETPTPLVTTATPSASTTVTATTVTATTTASEQSSPPAKQ